MQKRYNGKMHRIIPILILLLTGITSLAAQAEAGLPAYSMGYDPARDAFADSYAALKLARETNRRVLIEVGGQWCKWCHVMDQFFDTHPDVKQRLHQTFVMLKINVSDENDNAEFLKAFPPVPGYPHMYIADNNGKLLASKDTGEFFENGKYSRRQFMRFFADWSSPAAQPPVVISHAEASR